MQRDEAAWQVWVDKNPDPYGRACVTYAERWADLMEAAMATGTPLETCADPTSHAADVEGITGFMYGAAVQMLAQCWAHGEALRQWHNTKTQLRSEGDEANKTPGAVLNPAVLHLGKEPTP